MAGSLTGAVASQRVTEARDGGLKLVGNQLMSAMAEARLTARATARAETKVGHSDPVVPRVEGHRSTDKRYAGDNRLMTPKSTYSRRRLALGAKSAMRLLTGTNGAIELLIVKLGRLQRQARTPREDTSRKTSSQKARSQNSLLLASDLLASDPCTAWWL